MRTVQRQEPVIDRSRVQRVTTRRGATGTVGVSQRSRPGIRGTKLQTSSRAPVGGHLQRVVVRRASKSVRTDSRLPDRCCPSGITGVGTIKIRRQRCASIGGYGSSQCRVLIFRQPRTSERHSVEWHELNQVSRLHAHVRHIQQNLRWQFTLNPRTEVVHGRDMTVFRERCYLQWEQGSSRTADGGEIPIKNLSQLHRRRAGEKVGGITDRRRGNAFIIGSTPNAEGCLIVNCVRETESWAPLRTTAVDQSSRYTVLSRMDDAVGYVAYSGHDGSNQNRWGIFSRDWISRAALTINQGRLLARDFRRRVIGCGVEICE